jgi:hypothetical protein
MKQEKVTITKGKDIYNKGIKVGFSILKFIITIVTLIVLLRLFGYWGLLGYLLFVCIMAAWLLWQRRDLYITICQYGAHALDNYFTKRKLWNQKKK